MAAKNKTFIWVDLEKPKSAFTVRNATMRDLRNGEVIQYYSANTKIVVVQKCITEQGTFYRTSPAMTKSLDWAFEASAFGLPNEFAPPSKTLSNSLSFKKPEVAPPVEKQKRKSNKPPKGGEGDKPKKSLIRRLFSRKK